MKLPNYFKPLPSFKESYHSVRRFLGCGPFHFYWYQIGIRNLVRWLPVIWRDQDWDEGFMLTMWESKFRNMADFFASDNAWTGDAPEHAHQLRQCAELCRRIHADEYE